jgi:tetratricopeptide (TPR) repeat protein
MAAELHPFGAIPRLSNTWSMPKIWSEDSPMPRFSPVAIAFILVAQAQVFAQINTSRLGRAVDASKPRAFPEDEARRQAQNEAARMDRVPEYIEGDQYLRMPQGHYIIAPDKYRPDNWSPRVRPEVDYGPNGIGSGPNEFRSSHRYRGFRNNRYRNGGYGASWASDCYGCGSPYCRSNDVAGAYVQGRYDADHEYQDYIAAERAGRLLDSNRLGVSAGLGHFQAGRYDRAAIEWIGASERNQGDAASRVFAGHALFAVGRYDEAVKLLARAFELAPYLTESDYDVRTEYGDPSEFDTHLATLKAFVAKNPHNVPAMTLLGYVVAYSDGPAAAYPILAEADVLNPHDYFIQRLLNIARTVTPMKGVVPVQHEMQPAHDRAMPAKQRKWKAPTATIRKAIARAGHD